MTAMTIDPAAVDLPGGDLDDVADRIEAVLERAGRRGITAPSAARHARVDTATARQVLQWMFAHQYAHTDRRRAYTGRSR